MAAQVQAQNNVNRFPQRILQIDGVVELLLGAGLIVDAPVIAGWLGVSAPALIISGIGVLAFAGLLFYLAQRASRQTLMVIGLINIVGALLGVALLALDWHLFTMEGRWFIGVIADVFLTLGIAELVVRRFAP